MNNDYVLPADVDPSLFIKKFSRELAANLSDKIIKTLSNILALDYVSRLKKEIEITEHVNKCASRIIEYLGLKVITDESFSTCMTLFAIAISEKKEEKIDKTEQQLMEDIALESFITMHFGNISEAEKTTIKSLLRELSVGKDGHEIINFIHANPKLFYSLAASALKHKMKQREIAELVTLNMYKLISESKALDKKKDKTVNLGGKISLISALTALVSGGITLGGELLATILVPFSATVVKYSPVPGEKIGMAAVKNSPELQKRSSILEQVKSDIIDLSGKSQNVVNIMASSREAPLEAIKENLHRKKTSLGINELTHSDKVQKSKLENKGKGVGKFFS